MVQADAHKLPVSNSCVDRVTCRCGIMFFTYVDLALAEMLRVLKPGGRAAFGMGTVRAAFLRKHGWNCVALGFGGEDFRRDSRNVQICVPRLYWGRPAARRVSQYRRATRDTSQDLGWFAAGFMAILPGDQCPVPRAATSNPRKQANRGCGSRPHRTSSGSKRGYDYRISTSSPRNAEN